MAADKRPGFRARHLIRQVFRNKNFNVRLTAFNELMHHLSRRHRKKLPAAPLSLKAPGARVPLTGHARHLLRSLRKARAWNVVRRILAELHREIVRAHRRAVRIARAKARAVRAARTAGRRVAQGARAVRRGIGRAWSWLRPRAARGARARIGSARRRPAAPARTAPVRFRPPRALPPRTRAPRSPAPRTRAARTR